MSLESEVPAVDTVIRPGGTCPPGSGPLTGGRPCPLSTWTISSVAASAGRSCRSSRSCPSCSLGRQPSSPTSPGCGRTSSACSVPLMLAPWPVRSTCRATSRSRSARRAPRPPRTATPTASAASSSRRDATPATRASCFVDIDAPVGTFFAKVFCFNSSACLTSADVGVTGAATYVLPVPMGSPLAYYGVGDFRIPTRGSSGTVGPNAPTANDTPNNWSNANGAFADGGSSHANNNTGGAPGLSELRLQPCPPESTIDGIEVSIKARSTDNNGCADRGGPVLGQWDHLHDGEHPRAERLLPVGALSDAGRTHGQVGPDVDRHPGRRWVLPTARP